MKQIFSIVLASIFMTSCGIYSFTGASIPTEAKTVSVAYFTTTATNSPFDSLTIGPPLFPGFKAASICIKVESSSIPLSELMIPEVNFKSSDKFLPKG